MIVSLALAGIVSGEVSGTSDPGRSVWRPGSIAFRGAGRGPGQTGAMRSAFGVEHGPVSKAEGDPPRSKITGNYKQPRLPIVPPAPESRARVKGTLTALSQSGGA